MRREGFELEVSPPKVIFKEIDGEILEPVKLVIREVDPGYQGSVIEALGGRKAEMKNLLISAVGTVRMEFHIASRALLGFRSELLRMTEEPRDVANLSRIPAFTRETFLIVRPAC